MQGLWKKSRNRNPTNVITGEKRKRKRGWEEERAAGRQANNSFWKLNGIFQEPWNVNTFIKDKWLVGDRWMLLIIRPSLGPFLFLRLYPSILAGIWISWKKTLFQNLPLWHCPCTGFQNPMSGHFRHCAKTGDPAEQQTALGRNDTPAEPWVAAQRIHCPVKPYAAWLQKTPGVRISQKLNKWQRHSKHFSGLVGVGILWHFSKNTQVNGSVSNTANSESRLSRASLPLRLYIPGFIWVTVNGQQKN